MALTRPSVGPALSPYEKDETRNSRIYQFKGSYFTLVFGDITTSGAQVIVSSDDYKLTMSGGVSWAIRQAGGNAIPLDAAKMTPAAALAGYQAAHDVAQPLDKLKPAKRKKWSISFRRFRRSPVRQVPAI